MANREVSNDLCIQLYIHCSVCLTENLGEPQMLEVGWTKPGLQVWCKRHKINVIHIDFDGKQMKANLTRKEKQVNEQQDVG